MNIYAELKISHDYTCYLCGRVAAGTTRRESFLVGSASELADSISALRLRPTHMPVGWSHGDNGYACDICNHPDM